MDKVLEIEGLTKQFGAVKALDGLCLSLPKGCVFGFLGRNGAGKTTTLRLITGLARPTAGSVAVCGEPVAFGAGRTNRMVGYLPDVPQFYEWMRPGEYLSFCGRLSGMGAADAERRAKELLESTGLAGANRTVKGFSRGMKQRLGIAQALMHNPPLLLLDEPTSALDPLGRREVLDVIKGLGGRHTVLFSTHILADVERVCDRVGILHGGRLAVDGTLQEIADRVPMKAALLEVNGGSCGELAARLRSLPWVADVREGPAGACVVRTNDLNRLDGELCPLLAGLGLPLRRYEHMESTLEDVFVEVIGQ